MVNKYGLHVLSLSLLVLLAVSLVRAFPQEKAVIYGIVRDFVTGKCILNATVVIWDVYSYRRTVVKTNTTGVFCAEVIPGNAYCIYVYFDDERTPGFDYIPMKSSTFIVKAGDSLNISCVLFPGASIVLKGKIYDVRSRLARTYFIEIIDPLTGRPPHLEGCGNFSFIYSWGDSRDVKRMGLPKNIVVIPAGIRVDLKVWTKSLSMRRPVVPVDIEFLVDNEGSHFLLSQGEVDEVDVSWYSLKKTIKYTRKCWDEVWERLGDMERVGFYLGDLKEIMRRARTQIEEAETLWSQGRYQEAFSRLIEPYWIITVKVTYETNHMWLTAESSALFMPLFPAFFAITMGFFLFEDNKRKIISSCAFYVLSFILLYLVYPGFQIIEINRLLMLSSFIFLVVFFIVFILPRIIKEPEIPSPYPLRAILAVVFSIGKRNIRRRPIRGLLTIVSLTTLVLAFTAFTSFGRALSLLSEPVTGFSPPSDGILIKNLPLPWERMKEPYIAIPPEDIDAYKAHPKVVLVSPLVWVTSPEPDQPVGLLKVRNKEFEVFGMIGIDPSLEVKVTNIKTILIEGNISKLTIDDGIVISQEVAKHMNLRVGDVVSLYLYGLGFYRNFTVIGVMNSASLSRLIDLNGESILPHMKTLKEGKVIYERVEASRTLITHWKLPLKENQPLRDMASVSRIIVQLSEGTDVKQFVREVVFSREYTVWVSMDKRVTKYYIGEYLELGGLFIIVPLLIVLLNVGLVMISVVNERKREIFILTCIGFNPTHIASLFLAESVVMGLVGGGLGYLFGMSAYRLMNLFSIDIVVKQKLEWYWSVIGVLISVGTAVLSAVKPAMGAAMKVTPALVRKVRIVSEKEKTKRKERIWKVYIAQRVSMPVKVHESEIVFFSSFLSTRIREMMRGIYERIENYEESEEETPKGDLIKRFSFNYVFIEETKRIVIMNELRALKKRESKYYSLTLESKPGEPGIPETYVDRTIRIIKAILDEWEEERKRIMSGSRV